MIDPPEDIRGLAEAVKKIPAQGDLTLSRYREIAAPLDSAVSWEVDLEETVRVEPDG